MATGHASGALMAGVADPRHIPDADAIGKSNYNSEDNVEVTAPHSRVDFYNDANIQFEEYHYWANQSREIEKNIKTEGGGIFGLFKKKGSTKRNETLASNTAGGDEKKDLHDRPQEGQLVDTSSTVTDSEWENARGAMRTATWG